MTRRKFHALEVFGISAFQCIHSESIMLYTMASKINGYNYITDLHDFISIRVYFKILQN